jgi:hypothetical protein
MSAVRIYEDGQHRFFDDLVGMLVTYIAFGATMQAYRGANLDFADGGLLILRGRPNISGFDLRIDANDFLGPVNGGQFPSRLEFKQEAVEPYAGPLPVPARLLASTFHAGFVHYYESVVRGIESKHGRAQAGWPPVLNFGRVVRNAFTHRVVNFANPKAAAVTWRGITYSPADNGTNRGVLYKDLMPADLVLLMEEMDAAF